MSQCRLRSVSTALAFVTASVGALASLAPLGVAHASAPTGVYVVPTRLDFSPDQATATRVVIHGAFFVMDKGGTYGTPSCGVMTFQCAAGSEAMCRMQWNEIAGAIGQQFCEGFGTWNMVSSAKLYSEGAALGTPDTWDLGMGISPGSYVGGQCAPALALKCPLAAPPDMAVTPAPDMSVSPKLDMGPIPPAGDMAVATPARDMSAVAPVVDMAVAGTVSTPSSCAIGSVGSGRDSGPFAWAVASLLAGLALRRRSSRAVVRSSATLRSSSR